MDAVESLLEVHKVDLELSLSFRALHDDVTQREYLVYTSFSLPKRHFFLAQLLVYCII